jgi:hypothetical protein
MTITCDVDGRVEEIPDSGNEANFPADCTANPPHNICSLHAERGSRGDWTCPVCAKNSKGERL